MPEPLDGVGDQSSCGHYNRSKLQGHNYLGSINVIDAGCTHP